MGKERVEKLTQEELKELLSYDEETGVFTWIKSTSSNVTVGSAAGYVVECYGYRRVGIGGTKYLAHRLVFLYVSGSWPRNQVDHINGNRVDNRWSNLREVTNSENQRNRRLGGNNKSGFVGVSWDKPRDKWRSQIMVDGKSVHLGYFHDLENAIQVRKVASVKHNFHQNHGRQEVIKDE